MWVDDVFVTAAQKNDVTVLGQLQTNSSNFSERKEYNRIQQWVDLYFCNYKRNEDDPSRDKN